MKAFSPNTALECALYSEFAGNLADLAKIPMPARRIVLFIAADTVGESVDAIGEVVEHLFGSGVIYACTWGPDCMRVHDLFDEIHAGDGSSEPGFDLMTTWHDDEPLEEALWFFLNSAIPPDFEPEETAYVAVAVGNREWAQTIDDAFANVNDFNKRILEETD